MARRVGKLCLMVRRAPTGPRKRGDIGLAISDAAKTAAISIRNFYAVGLARRQKNRS